VQFSGLPFIAKLGRYTWSFLALIAAGGAFTGEKFRGFPGRENRPGFSLENHQIGHSGTLAGKKKPLLWWGCGDFSRTMVCRDKKSRYVVMKITRNTIPFPAFVVWRSEHDHYTNNNLRYSCDFVGWEIGWDLYSLEIVVQGKCPGFSGKS
jgi:hypothetical protein